MGTIAELRRKVERLNLEEISSEAISETKEYIVAENREQLFEGKLASGKDIFPTYLDDPFFKSRESAQRYSDWKDSIDPKPGKRKKGVPNLFITGGYVHDPLQVEVKGKDITYDIVSPIGSKIFSKYGDNVTGLNPEHTGKYVNGHLRAPWQKKITLATGLKFGR